MWISHECKLIRLFGFEISLNGLARVKGAMINLFVRIRFKCERVRE